MTPFDKIRVENLVIDVPLGGGLVRRNHLRDANAISLTLRAHHQPHPDARIRTDHGR